MCQQNEKQAAMEARLNQAKCDDPNTLGGSIGGYAVDTEYRPTLRNRLMRTINDAGRQQRQARNANELFDLLNKHPEVARILELIEEVGK